VLLGQEVHRLVGDLVVVGHVVEALAPLEEPAQPPRVHDRTGEEVRTGLLAFLDDCDGHLAQPLRRLRVLGQELAEPDRAGEPCRAAADDQDADLDRIAVGRPGDRLLDAPGRRVVGGDRAH
jgi:hypothetical protein